MQNDLYYIKSTADMKNKYIEEYLKTWNIIDMLLSEVACYK